METLIMNKAIKFLKEIFESLPYNSSMLFYVYVFTVSHVVKFTLDF